MITTKNDRLAKLLSRAERELFRYYFGRSITDNQAMMCLLTDISNEIGDHSGSRAEAALIDRERITG